MFDKQLHNKLHRMKPEVIARRKQTNKAYRENFYRSRVDKSRYDKTEVHDAQQLMHFSGEKFVKMFNRFVGNES